MKPAASPAPGLARNSLPSRAASSANELPKTRWGRPVIVAGSSPIGIEYQTKSGLLFMQFGEFPAISGGLDRMTGGIAVGRVDGDGRGVTGQETHVGLFKSAESGRGTGGKLVHMTPDGFNRPMSSLRSAITGCHSKSRRR